MQNTKNVNWVDSAELKAVRIDNTYGKKETEFSLIFSILVLLLFFFVISSYLIITYGDFAIINIRNFITRGNFFETALTVLSVLGTASFIMSVVFSINGIKKTSVGINHQVNTKSNLTLNIISLTLCSCMFIIFVGLLLLRLILLKFM